MTEKQTSELLVAAEWVLRSAGYKSGEAEPTLRELNVGIPHLERLRLAVLNARQKPANTLLSQLEIDEMLADKADAGPTPMQGRLAAMLRETEAGPEPEARQAGLRDVLTDLRHVAAAGDLDFDAALEGSEAAYAEENGETHA